MRQREIEALGEKLPNLTEFELQFLLAYIGAHPKSPHPISPHKAYLAVRPHVKLTTAHTNARDVLRRIQRKGGLSLILDHMGLTMAKAVEVLRDCTQAETIRVVHLPDGAWDYAFTPDHCTRLRAARTILELHGAFQPGENHDDARLTFADAVLLLTEQEERRQLLGQQTDDAAEDVEFNDLDE
jgi:hypothetical protein